MVVTGTFYPAITAPDARLAQLVAGRLLRHEGGEFARCRRQQLAAGAEQGNVLHAGLVAQIAQRRAPFTVAQIAQFEGDGLPFVGEVVEQRVKRAASKVETRFERLLDADVEPRFDALGDELDRHRIDEDAGQHGHQAEHQHQAQLQPGAEDLGPVL